MRGDERGHITVPAAKQNRRTPVVVLRQTETTVFPRHLNSKRTDLCKSGEIFWWNFTGPIDLVRVDVITQKIFAGGAIFGTLRRPGINSIEIVASDEKIARKTAAVIEWIARGFG